MSCHNLLSFCFKFSRLLASLCLHKVIKLVAYSLWFIALNKGFANAFYLFIKQYDLWHVVGTLNEYFMYANCNTAICSFGHQHPFYNFPLFEWMVLMRNWKTCHSVELCLMTNYRPCILITSTISFINTNHQVQATLKVYRILYCLLHCSKSQ